MANKTPNTAGGKLLATEVFIFMKDNIDTMKSNGANKDAAANETQGTQDIANAIAFAIEKVFSSNTFVVGPPSALVAGPSPVLGSLQLSTGAPYVFK